MQHPGVSGRARPGSRVSNDLPEIREADAEGRTAEIYEEIRRAVGLPLVNLVYRVLAANGRLDPSWAQVRPNLCDPSIAAAAAGVVKAGTIGDWPGIPPTAIAAAGIGDERRERARATIDAYVHSNPRNLLAITTLLEPAVTAGEAPSIREPGEAPHWDLLPMADLATLAPQTRALLDEMSRPIVAPGEAVLVPSLLRHFSDNPCFLGLLWTAIAPVAASGAIARAADAVITMSTDEARRLPHPVERIDDPETRDILERFRFTIARMIVVSQLMRAAVAPVTP